MKPSHTQTPRTMSETTFTTGYHSANYHRPYDRADRHMMWAALVCAIITALVVVFVPEVKA